MMCNMGLIYAAMGDHEAAVSWAWVLPTFVGGQLMTFGQVEHFQAATSMDPYLAIASVDSSHSYQTMLTFILFAVTFNPESAIL